MFCLEAIIQKFLPFGHDASVSFAIYFEERSEVAGSENWVNSVSRPLEP